MSKLAHSDEVGMMVIEALIRRDAGEFRLTTIQLRSDLWAAYHNYLDDVGDGPTEAHAIYDLVTNHPKEP